MTGKGENVSLPIAGRDQGKKHNVNKEGRVSPKDRHAEVRTVGG